MAEATIVGLLDCNITIIASRMAGNISEASRLFLHAETDRRQSHHMYAV